MKIANIEVDNFDDLIGKKIIIKDLNQLKNKNWISSYNSIEQPWKDFFKYEIKNKIFTISKVEVDFYIKIFCKEFNPIFFKISKKYGINRNLKDFYIVPYEIEQILKINFNWPNDLFKWN